MTKILIKKHLKYYCFLFAIICSLIANSQEKDIDISGIVTDQTNFALPYVAIGVENKNIGSSSNEDGEFLFRVSRSELQDSLFVSYLGFNTFKIKIADYLAKKENKIILTENVVNLSDVQLLPPKSYVINALKKLKENTLYQTHQVEMLYRRAATEAGKAKFFAENYIKIRDRGPASSLGRIQVTELRKSADYRIWKREQWRHSIVGLYEVNPLRPIESQHRRNLKKFIWKKIGDSSYEDEDVLILEGQNPKKKWEKIKMFIGMDSYKVYRIERGQALYIFKKHSNGKLYLSYHKNEWSFPKDKIPKHYLNTPAKDMHYRLEAFVYKIETDKKKIKVRDYGVDKDMGALDLPYHPEFWKNLVLPPETKFYKKIKSELEGIYGVPLETQYKLVNK
jgi:hypothetical protein